MSINLFAPDQVPAPWKSNTFSLSVQYEAVSLYSEMISGDRPGWLTGPDRAARWQVRNKQKQNSNRNHDSGTPISSSLSSEESIRASI